MWIDVDECERELRTHVDQCGSMRTHVNANCGSIWGNRRIRNSVSTVGPHGSMWIRHLKRWEQIETFRRKNEKRIVGCEKGKEREGKGYKFVQVADSLCTHRQTDSDSKRSIEFPESSGIFSRIFSGWAISNILKFSRFKDLTEFLKKMSKTIEKRWFFERKIVFLKKL